MIKVNGVIYSGNNLTIRNNKILIDGKDVTVDAKQINISIEGNVEKLEVDSCEKVSITGDVGNVKTLNGDVDISGDVKGSVQTMSGDVDCRNINGSVSTMSGDVKHRKN